MRTLQCAFAVIVACLTWAPESMAQDDTTSQLWADYHTHYFRTEHNEFYGDAGARFQVDNPDWWKVYARPSLRFHRRKRLDVHVGIGAFYTHDPDDPTLEIRPWQGVKIRWPIFTHIFFSHYFRLEERFVASKTDRDADFSGRLRYKLSTRIALKRHLRHLALDAFYIPLSAEFFADFGPRVDEFFADDLRLSVGFGYIGNSKWIGEIHFILQESRSGRDDVFSTTDYIVRIQLKHLIEAKDYRLTREDLPE